LTIGVGGSVPTAVLQAKQSLRSDAHPISNKERGKRIEKAQELMRQQGIAALYLDASTRLSYYTGLLADGKKRLHGEVIPTDGPLSYICPAFEVVKTTASIVMRGEIRGWNKYGIGPDVQELTYLVRENPCAFDTRHVFLERAAGLHLR